MGVLGVGKRKIKCIHDNLLFTEDGKVFAYYRMDDYNNSFVSDDRKIDISDHLELMFQQTDALDMRLLCLGVKRSIDDLTRQGKGEIKGELSGYTDQYTDKETVELKKHYGSQLIRYRYYIGFELRLEVDNLKDILLDFWGDVEDWVYSISHRMAGDYVKIAKAELERYRYIERILYQRICSHFYFERLSPREYGYIIEHISGLNDRAFEDYRTRFLIREEEENYSYRRYDYIKLEEAAIEEKPKHLVLLREDQEVYVSYMAISTIINDLDFPTHEVLYELTRQFSFPVDVSINVSAVQNKGAIKLVRDKRAELKDLMENAAKNDVDISSDLVEADEVAAELMDDLRRTREKLYKVSFLIRIEAKDKKELQERCIAVRDFFDGFAIDTVRPIGNQLHFHFEFMPGGKNQVRDYLQPVRANFMSCLGFGAATKLGDGYGIYIGENLDSLQPVYLRPWLAAQAKEQTKTSSLSCLFSGQTGSGKSMSVKLLMYKLVLYGSRVLYIDPKSELLHIEKELPELSGQINIIHIQTSRENRGILDPFVVLSDTEKAVSLAGNILGYLLGIGLDDYDRYPVLQEALHKVAQRPDKGLALVVKELEGMNNPYADGLAKHIGSFISHGFATLLFSDGKADVREIRFDHLLNILEVADLDLPDATLPKESYSITNKLSIAMQMVIAEFGEQFLFSDKSVFKAFIVDEAWAMLGTERGRQLQSSVVRMGRSLNCAMYLISQNVYDTGDEKIRNNIGMKFAFHAEDRKEIQNILEFFDLDPNDEALHKRIRSLRVGECFFMDVFGRKGVMKFDAVFPRLYDAFDTSTGKADLMQPQIKEMQKEMGRSKQEQLQQTDPSEEVITLSADEWVIRKSKERQVK